MIPNISKIRGIHPGIILKRELKLQGIKNKELASQIEEHAQTIGAILNGKRSVNPALSVKLGRKFGVNSDYFMLLQASYDVKIVEQKLTDRKTPDLKKIRKALFWDTDIQRINWNKNRRAVIRRIFERGNEREINEILHFYGTDVVKMEIENIGSNFLPSFEYNVKKYIGRK